MIPLIKAEWWLLVGGGSGCLMGIEFVLLNEKNFDICYTTINVLHIIELGT